MPLNVYTMMLVIAFICITAACVLLWQELKQWGEGPTWWNATGSITTSTDLARSFPLETTLDNLERFEMS